MSTGPDPRIVRGYGPVAAVAAARFILFRCQHISEGVCRSSLGAVIGMGIALQHLRGLVARDLHRGRHIDVAVPLEDAGGRMAQAVYRDFGWKAIAELLLPEPLLERRLEGMLTPSRLDDGGRARLVQSYAFELGGLNFPSFRQRVDQERRARVLVDAVVVDGLLEHALQ